MLTNKLPSLTLMVVVCVLALWLPTPGAAQTGSNTSSPVSPPPASTTAVPPAVLPSDEVDFRLSLFCDEKLVDYRVMLADIATVPVSRIVPRFYGNSAAAEFGNEYIFTVVVGPPTNRSGDDQQANEVASRLAVSVTDLVAARDPRIRQATVLRASHVLPEPRVQEKGSLSVDYTWVAFLLIGIATVVGSIAILTRRRRAREDDDPNEEHDEDDLALRQRPVPKDAVGENQDQILRMIERADERKAADEVKRREANAYAPSYQLFSQLLDSDHRLRLPPPCAVQDPLAEDFKHDAPVAPTSRLGTAAEVALHQIRTEGDVKAEPPRPSKKQNSVPPTPAGQPHRVSAPPTPAGPPRVGSTVQHPSRVPRRTASMSSDELNAL